jgi:hypothetical protein
MLIVHRCQTCGHPDYWASRLGPTIDNRKHCEGGCGCRRCTWGPPETAPRWSSADNTPVTTPAEPGTLGTCACDDCRALYAELVGMATAQLGAPT